MPTGIPYCDETWDVVTGCSPDQFNLVCRERCWAAALARQRPATHGGLGSGPCPDCDGRGYYLCSCYDGPSNHKGDPCRRCKGKGTLPAIMPVPFSRLVLHPDRLDQPLHWRKPRVVLVCSRGDLFHDAVPDEFIFRVCRTIAAAPHHRYLLLTKRWERMSGMVLPMLEHLGANGDPVWWGFSAWDNDSAKRVAEIVRNRFMQCDQVWLSLEPLLGPVDLGEDMGLFNFVVAGCESGPGARHTPCQWLRDVSTQCQLAGVPCYIKQASGEPGESRVIRFPPQPGELPWRLPAKGA